MALDTIAVARAEIAQIYIAAFNRVPDAAGLSNWLNQYTAGLMTYAQIAEDFTHQAEYQAKYPSIMTNTEYVTEIYQNVFGRMPDAGGLTNWVNQLDHTSITGINRGNIMKLMLDAAGATGNTDGERLDNQAAFAVQSILDGVDTDAATAQLANITSDSTTVTTAQTAVSSGAGTAGGTYALTTGTDILNTTTTVAANKTTANDDTIYATTADSFDSDIIDGGAGADSIIASYTANSNTITPTSVTNVETITATVTAVNAKSWTFDAANITGVNTFNLKNAGAASMSSSDELITVNNLVKTATLGIIGGTASTGTTASEITATFASAAAADTQKVAISTLGKVGVLTLSTAETVEITATGTGTTGANTIGSLAATAVKTLNLKGSGDLTISASNLAAAVTVDASTSTGVISFTGETAATSTTFTGGTGATTVNTASTGTVTITTGAGNDTISFLTAANTATVSTGAGDDSVNVGASSNVTAADSINGGDGTDTIIVSDTTINATTKTALALGVSNFEYLGASATAELSIDFVALSAYNTVVVSGASGATAAVANTAGNASINVTKMENTDALVIAAARVGQDGGVATATSGVDTSLVGGNGITLAPSVDGGANAATLKLVGNADITGGAGGAANSGSGDTGGDGGIGISASTIETLNIEIAGTQISTGTADTVTIAGGAGGATAGSGTVAGSAGSDLVVGTNATITLTDSLFGATAALYNNVDLGTVVGTNVTVNASAMHGNVTVTAASGNVTLTGGAGNDTLTGGAGTDTISGGAGNDIIDAGNGADILSGGTGRDSFVISAAADSDTTNYNTISDFGKVTAATSVAQTAAMTNTAAFQATATSFGGANADMLDMATAATLAAAAIGTNVAASIGGGTLTADISAKGIITVQGASLANLDTLAEWVSIANTMAGTNGNVAVFEYDGNTYVFQQDSGAGDDLVQLTGVTGVTGITLVASSVAAAAGDIFVI